MAGLRCLVCGGQPEKTTFGYRTPDKYEKWVGLENVKRLWVKCKKCGFYWQLRNYPLSDLEKIYKTGYRSEDFRGESIEDAYRRILNIRDSENERRYYWFGSHVRYKESKKVLDIGSGIGVWPAILKTAEYDVTCVEENRDSVDFISSELGLKCYYNLDDVDDDFDCITVVHVLEHIQDLRGFLAKIEKRLRVGGHLFIEVPDNSEFKRFGKYHDEFNSCHEWFFDMPSLAALMKRYRFDPVHSSTVTYDSRGLSRVYMLCN